VMSFNENLQATLAAADLALLNQTTGGTVPAANIALNYVVSPSNATFTFPGYASGVLPNGNYQASLPAASVTDVAGNPLASDVLLNFFFIQGDADHNGVINFDDYARIDLAFNTGLSGFGNGDFNYDGVVNFDDYAIIDLAFNSQ
jgi:hypothetical protein